MYNVCIKWLFLVKIVYRLILIFFCRFGSEYKAQPWRGYGGNVVTVLESLQDEDIEDVFKPASLQFDGSGSFGNGGAMRIAPVPLFTHFDTNTVQLKVAYN